jgi:hypothetical protein
MLSDEAIEKLRQDYLAGKIDLSEYEERIGNILSWFAQRSELDASGDVSIPK